MPKLTHQQQVRQHYPDACGYFLAQDGILVFEVRWMPGGAILATGRTSSEAWAKALAKIKTEKFMQRIVRKCLQTK